MHKWGIPQSQFREAVAVRNNPELAFQMMLPQQSRRLEYLNYQASFFTNQIYKEARRVIMLDYTMARESFVDLGEQLVHHNIQMHNGWVRFIKYYSNLNNARKEQDDNYMQFQGIGEEVAEPDSRGMFVSTLKDHEPTFKDKPVRVEFDRDRSQSMALPPTQPVEQKASSQEDQERKELRALDATLSKAEEPNAELLSGDAQDGQAE